MKKRFLNGWEYLPQVLNQLPKGILLNTQADGLSDTMTIGWAEFGIDWGIQVVTVFIRESRYTKELLEKNLQFSLSCPLEGMNAKEILGFCGTKSGRDVDKFEALNLIKVEGETVQVPAVAQLPLTIEAQVIYKQDQDPQAIESEILDRYYPKGDFHTAYTAKITAAYILEE